MGKPRIRGSHAKILVHDQDGKPLEVGEISKFSVKELGELKKSRAIGEHEITSTKTFEGYDLSFEGGKVDWQLAQLLHEQDVNIVTNNRTPYFQVVQTITYYGTDKTETYTFPQVTIHGYSLDIDANDEMTEKFEGFCGKRKDVTPVTGGGQAEVQKKITAMIEKALTFDAAGND